MDTNTYIINKLKSVDSVANLLSYMRDKGGCYVAGGAMTSIATGNHDKIEDYDIYFPSKEAAVNAIRYMKEQKPHVSFVSDKSITYVIGDTVKIQFIYYDFYPKAEDIFNHFDFTINMMAYDSRDDSISTHENFWMHNSQRFLSVNTGTKFPIISQLRLDKYTKRGYKTSRNEMLKLSLSIANLNITTWEEAKEQIGNTYGFTLADFNDCEGKDFSICSLIERIESTEDGENTPMQDQYLYPHDAVDFLIEGKPIQYVTISGTKYFTDETVLDAEQGVKNLIERELLQESEIELDQLLEGEFYIVTNREYQQDEVVNNGGWDKLYLYKLETLPLHYYHLRGFVYHVVFDKGDVKGLSGSALQIDKFTVVKKVCRDHQINDLKEGKPVEFRPNAKMKGSSCNKEGWAFKEKAEFIQGKIVQLKELRSEHISDNIIVTGKKPYYAHCKFEGIILEGGEDITAEELLYHMDGYNLSFGGNISIKSNGEFSGRYNTD